jgi:N-acetyl-gamma-glutamyl-phosphate reductase
MIKVGIVGGTGYTGVELLRLLLAHPNVVISAITSRAEAGKPVADVFHSLRGRLDLQFTAPDQADLRTCDVVFFATPNGVAMKQVAPLLNAGVRVIDLSADFRLRNADQWSRWYGMPHAAPELLDLAVYGLPELFREHIALAQLVANPGCYPTAVQLGLLPLVEDGCVDTSHLIADAASGVSGAGRKAEMRILFAEAGDSFSAYAVSGHRHLPEIIQGLSHASPTPVGLTFVPHLAPMIRGIHATLYARLTRDTDVQMLFEKRYALESFVDVLPASSCPDTRSVRAANTCRLAIHRPQGSDTLVILSVIDNLMKGAAGQAVQNMNLMFGINECSGLSHIPVLP